MRKLLPWLLVALVFAFPINAAYQPVLYNSTDANNTTTSTLAAGATYTGTATNITDYAQVHVMLYVEPNVVPNGDANTAQGSLYVEFGPDGTNWDISIPVVVRNGLFIPQTYINTGPYYRVRYINDGGAAAIASLGLTETADTARTQTAFRLTSLLMAMGTKELGRTLDQSVFGSDPVSLTSSAIMGKNPSGQYIPVPVTAAGELFVQSAAAENDLHGVYQNASFTADTWKILVDLSDTSGFFHTETGAVHMSSFKVAIDPGSNSVGAVRIGVITAIDGTDADISYLFSAPFGKNPARILSDNNFNPSTLKFNVSGGALTKAVTDITETTTSVNTGGTLTTPIGTATPAVGDVIVKFDHTSGNAWDAQIGWFWRTVE